MRKSICSLATLLLVATLSPAAVAQWPDRPVQMIVPFPAGGVIDVVARRFAQYLAAQVEKPVVVVNRDGASGTIGLAAIATSNDGHTVGFVPNGPLVVQPLLRANLGYETSAFKPICQINSYTFVVAVPASSPIGSLKELLQAAQATTSGLSVAYAGVGTAQHFVILEMARNHGAKLLPVPYRGDPPVATAMKSGEVQAAVMSLEVARPQGFKVFAVTSDQRHPSFPEVGTLREQGVNVVAKTYVGLVAPASMPAVALRRLESACDAIMRGSDMQESLKQMNMQADFQGRAEFEATVRTDLEQKRKLVEASGIKVE